MGRSRTLDYYHKHILSTTSAFALTASLVMVMIGGGDLTPAMTTQQQVFAQPAGGETSQAGEGQQPAATTTIEMTPTEEVNGTYRWSVDNNINPTITLVANVDNTITFNNPTDDEHQLIIAMAEGGGGEEEEEMATTEDVEPGDQGELSITPNATDSLRYYCEYHPQTMLGDIRITNATTTMTNQTQ
jgi:plastocyanin